MSRRVLVTGSSRGIGRQIAITLGRSGFDIVVHFKARQDAADEVTAIVRDSGVEARLLQFDISDREKTAAALEADMDANGAYYGIVCNAGIVNDAAFPAMDGDVWDSVIRTNLDGLEKKKKAGPFLTIIY